MSQAVVKTVSPDILVEVMRLLARDGSGVGRATLADMSRTCKYLRFEGVQLLLSGTVVVYERIPSFCCFMLSDNTTRPPLLRNLALDISQMPENALEALGEVLHRAINLHQLFLREHDLPPSSFKTALYTLIASHTSVRHLVLNTVSSLSALETFFRNIQAPLSSIFVCFPWEGESNQEGPIMYTRRRDPVFLLSRLTKTLEDVQLKGFVTFGSYTCRYPSVKELRLPDHNFSVPIIRSAIFSFPHLEVLYMGPPDDNYFRCPHESEILGRTYIGKRTIQQCHDINTQDQLVHGTWPMLKSMKATIVAAYSFGVSCHVERLHLLSSGGKREEELTMLSAILSYAKPRTLRLALRAFNARGYIPIFSSTTPWSVSLETLELRLNIAQEAFDYQECFTYIQRLLGDMYLNSLRLELICTNTEHIDESTERGVDYSGLKCEPYWKEGYWWHCFTECALLREDLPQRVRDCMRASPTLRRMSVLWARCDATCPNRVVTIDLDNPSGSCDRPGEETDGYYIVGYLW